MVFFIIKKELPHISAEPNNAALPSFVLFFLFIQTLILLNCFSVKYNNTIYQYIAATSFHPNFCSFPPCFLYGTMLE